MVSRSRKRTSCSKREPGWNNIPGIEQPGHCVPFPQRFSALYHPAEPATIPTGRTGYHTKKLHVCCDEPSRMGHADGLCSRHFVCEKGRHNLFYAFFGRLEIQGV